MLSAFLTFNKFSVLASYFRRNNIRFVKGSKMVKRIIQPLITFSKEKRPLKALELEFEAKETERKYYETLHSFHKNCSETHDWGAIKDSKPPVKPIYYHSCEKSAQAKMDKYKQGFLDRILGLTDLNCKRLRRTVEKSRKKDEMAYKKTLDTYEKEYSDWKRNHDFACRILEGNTEAYIEILEKTFSSLKLEITNPINCKISSSVIEASFFTNSTEVVYPFEPSKVSSSGKRVISDKPISNIKYNERYQIHVCSLVLRIARELLALLPIKMVIVNVMEKRLNTQTGHMEEIIILSVAIPRGKLLELNFEMLYPPDAMKNFVYRMSFKKTKGFASVKNIRLSDLKITESS